MAGKVPFSNLSEASQDPNTASPSSSYDMFPQTSELEYMGNICSVTRNWSESPGCASDLNFYQQIQEQYKCSVDQCLTELQNIKRKREATFIQMKKIIREKVDSLMKAVRQSFEHMHSEGTKKLELKCEEIGRVLARIDKMLEEGSQDVSMEYNREEAIINQNFLNKMLEEKQKIELEVETTIQQLNSKRESDEQLYMEFKEDVQQKVQSGLSRIERSLEFQADRQARVVEEKITELRRALTNLQHLSKFA